MFKNREYVSLLVADQDNNSIKSKRSIWRLWNQLSRLQRTLLYIILILGIIISLYILSNIFETENNKLIEKHSPIDEFNNVLPQQSYSTKSNSKVDVDNNVRQGVAQGVQGVLEHPNNQNVNVKDDAPKYFTGPTNTRQIAVVNAFKHAWKGYKTFAWGNDHLKPISASYSNWFGVGLTIIDSLDTMYIMNLQEEYEEAREWVEQKLTFDIPSDVNLFEITIRVLGGLLSIYHLTSDKMYLDKARDLGERLLPCFNTDSGIPYSDINLRTGLAHAPKWSPDSSTSEVTTIQLEFRDLSRSTGDSRFEEVASKISDHVHELPKKHGLVPIFINALSGKFRQYSTITMGARGDSYYEYLLKQWLQTGKTIDYFRDDYLQAMKGAQEVLMKRTPASNLLFIGELLGSDDNFKPKMDHLTCYLSGTLALGAYNGLPRQHLSIAEDLLTTCYQMYARQPTFLAPEIAYFNIQDKTAADLYVKSGDSHNLLRPEFIESLWYMAEIVPENRTRYQEWGWRIFQAFENFTKVTNGYTSIANVRNIKQTRPLDKMESFFLAETLKYLYLLFRDENQEISLDEYVVNSEAHFIPIKF